MPFATRRRWIALVASVALLAGCTRSNVDEERLAKLEQRVRAIEIALNRSSRDEQKPRRRDDASDQERARPTTPYNVPKPKPQPDDTKPTPADPPDQTLVGHANVAIDFGPLTQTFEIGEGSRAGDKFLYQMTALKPVGLDERDALARYRMFAYAEDGGRLGNSPAELLPKKLVGDYNVGDSVRLRFELPSEPAKIARLKFQAFAE